MGASHCTYIYIYILWFMVDQYGWILWFMVDITWYITWYNYTYLVGGAITILKIWLRQWVSDDIPHMKWKIIHSCSKAPTSYITVASLRNPWKKSFGNPWSVNHELLRRCVEDVPYGPPQQNRDGALRKCDVRGMMTSSSGNRNVASQTVAKDT